MNNHTDPKFFAMIKQGVIVTVYHPKNPDLALAVTPDGYTVCVDDYFSYPSLTPVPRWKDNLKGWLRAYTR